MCRLSSGWFVVDKPLGWTSTDVVRLLKRHVPKNTKIGHAGTLDPMATGVLPVAYGQATKAIPYLSQTSKAYRFSIRFGVATSTDDQEGVIVSTHRYRPSQHDIEQALVCFHGEILQVPPVYSAVKVNGCRAYKLARLGQAPILEPRRVTIQSFRFLEWVIPGLEALFEVRCGSGSYIRALARDLALALGTCGYVPFLERTDVGPFSQDLATPPHEAAGKPFPLEAGFEHTQRVELDPPTAHKLMQGQTVWVPHMMGEGTLLACTENKPIAFISVERNHVRPLRVFLED